MRQRLRIKAGITVLLRSSLDNISFNSALLGCYGIFDWNRELWRLLKPALILHDVTFM